MLREEPHRFLLVGRRHFSVYEPHANILKRALLQIFECLFRRFRIDFLRFFPERIDDKYLLAFFDAPVSAGGNPGVAEHGALEVVARRTGGRQPLDLATSDEQHSEDERANEPHRPLLPQG